MKQCLKQQMDGLRRENAGLKAEHESLHFSMERALLALEDHKKEQQQVQLEVIIFIHSAVAPRRQTLTRHVPAHPGTCNLDSIFGSAFAAIFQQYFSLASGYRRGPAAVQVVPSTINNVANQNLALLQRLQASGGVQAPTSSQLSHQIRRMVVLGFASHGHESRHVNF